ncbi:hypothetical protein [Methylibium rhizosphaerae]|uniref:hypothetical protein n=1 Tax=Methylibium rhizosphaerae TaxID=2570323 RepID=UPI001125C507|nr:hypothetical protein [Methylibium rhizosphaerae]
MKSRPFPFDDTQSPVDVPPPIPALSWAGALSPLLLVPMAIPVLVALFAPDNVLDLWPWARRFTACVQRMVPFMNMSAHANSTVFPQVALLAHSLTVALIPVLSLVWTVQSVAVYPQNLARRSALGRMPVKQHLMVLLSPLLFLGSIYFFIAIPGDPSFGKGFTTHSRGGFAFLTACGLYPTTMGLGAQLANIRIFIDTYLKPRA